MSSKLTSDSVYRQGTYEIIYKEAAIEKCLNSRSCQACEVKSKTVTIPSTTGADFSLASHPFVRNTDFPAGSYLLDFKVDATLTSGNDGNWIADWGYLFAKPNTNPPEAFAGAGNSFGGDFYVPLEQTSGNCFGTDSFPVSCTQSTPYSICNRYTFAATKENNFDQLTPENFGFAESYGLPQAPTFCFPVFELDLATYGTVYLYHGWFGTPTIRGTATFYYTSVKK